MILTRIILLSAISVVCSSTTDEPTTCSNCCSSPAGIPGIPGTHGASGEPGQKGDAGINGEKGEPGKGKGSKGDDGQQGIPGEIGPAGENGSEGEKGEKGDTGVQGIIGYKGDMGDMGDPGTDGSTGAVGPAGPTGPKGDEGDPTQQLQSAFSVYGLNTLENEQPVSPIIFKYWNNNIGSHYNIGTGKFVCKIAGTYVFSYACTKQSGNVDLFVEIRKNGNVLIRSYDNNPNHATMSNSVITTLAVDDEVWLQPTRSSSNSFYYNYARMNSFSGFLLYAS